MRTLKKRVRDAWRDGSLFEKYKVRWMSGLVTGLQNRLQRFESASDLTKTALE